MTKLKTILLTITLSLTGCLDLVPNPPEIWQCGYSVKFNKFRCKNTVTGQAVNVDRNDSAMEASQCLRADDYKAMARWIDQVKEIANKRCK